VGRCGPAEALLWLWLWLGLVLRLGIPSSGGDLVIDATLTGYAFLLVGTVAAAIELWYRTGQPESAEMAVSEAAGRRYPRFSLDPPLRWRG